MKNEIAFKIAIAVNNFVSEINDIFIHYGIDGDIYEMIDDGEEDRENIKKLMKVGYDHETAKKLNNEGVDVDECGRKIVDIIKRK